MDTRIGEDNLTTQGRTSPSYMEALREIGVSTKDVLRSEVALFKAEMEASVHNAGKHAAQMAIFGGLLALSVLPFLAFLVIGLGNLIGGMYWLSSLIVAVVCAVIGGPLAYRAYVELKTHDLKFEQTRNSFRREADAVQKTFDDVRAAAKGDRNEFDRLH